MRVHPPQANQVEYAFHDWLGDELITSHPVFLVTTALAEVLAASKLTGFELRDASTTLADEGEDWISDVSTLPAFRWLVITGTAGDEDFGLMPNSTLVVSDAGLAALRTRQLEFCDVIPYEAE
ncbi:hypothetical protein [Actinokineospora inagensis]|uniref:hypothetical protein n=1 Tax=Actinokineospora inagensis TaxID=103730 RepID=UPI001FE00DAB|nr:hypothetical protein [Actinokineospora inagensis]